MDIPPKPSLLERLSALLSREPEDRDELLALLHSAFDRNLIDADALSIIEGALQMSDLQVRDVMVPRAQMDCVHLDDPIDVIANFAIDTAHSRFPAIGDGKDDVAGILLAKDLLRYFAGREFDLRDMLRSFRPTRAQLFTKLVLPATLPVMLTSWKINLSLAIRVVTIAELVGAVTGIGYGLVVAQELFSVSEVFAWTLILVVLLFAAEAVLTHVEERVLRWRA